MNIVALIPARGGSKGIPGKNIKPLNGRPLIDYTISEAKKANRISRVVVSTDSQSIADVAVSCGADVPFLRPAELASDTSPGIDPVLHFLEQTPGVDLLVLLQPTSPFRTAKHISEAIDLSLKNKAINVVSVVESPKHPAWMYRVNDDGLLRKFIDQDAPRRQDLEPIFLLNGAIYIAKPEVLVADRSFLGRDTLAYRMPADTSVDLDSVADWDYAEYCLRRRLG